MHNMYVLGMLKQIEMYWHGKFIRHILKKIITSPFKNYTQKHANLEKVLETNINMKQ